MTLFAGDRTIVSIEDIEDTDWSNVVACMTTTRDMAESCSSTADKVIVQTYENEGDKRFYTLLCNACADQHTEDFDLAEGLSEDLL